MYYCQDANMYEKVTSVISWNCPTIDYILANDILVKNITRSNVKTTPSPDHRALIIINIESHNHQRGKSYLKLNVSVLDHDKYKCKITEIFDEVINSSKYLALDIRMNWGLIKVKIRDYIIL